VRPAPPRHVSPLICRLKLAPGVADANDVVREAGVRGERPRLSSSRSIDISLVEAHCAHIGLASNLRFISRPHGAAMTDQRAARGELVRHLQNALAIADELEDRKMGHLIKQALDQAQSQKGEDPRQAERKGSARNRGCR
jgi:hypothetical protein